jgi:hypothetical protein
MKSYVRWQAAILAALALGSTSLTGATAQGQSRASRDIYASFDDTVDQADWSEDGCPVDYGTSPGGCDYGYGGSEVCNGGCESGSCDGTCGYGCCGS